LDYHGPLALSWDDTDLEKALCVYEKSKGFFSVIGNIGDPIIVAPTDDLESVFENANIAKANKVSRGIDYWLCLI
jgi:hypothetical protein